MEEIVTADAPSAGDVLHCSDKFYGTFTGKTQVCECGGTAYEVNDHSETGVNRPAFLCDKIYHRVGGNRFDVNDTKVMMMLEFIIGRIIYKDKINAIG